MRRHACQFVAVLAFAGGLLTTAPAASAAPITCAFDATTHVLSVSAPEGSAPTVKRSGDLLAVTDCLGLTATVHDTDRIAVTGSYRHFRIDLSGGPLAPGFSPEPDGDPEIELTADASARQWVAVVGSDGADHIRLGATGGFPSINLNATEAVGDADVVFKGISPNSGALYGGGGDDVLDARGGVGTGGPLGLRAFDLLDLNGDDGNDELHGMSGWNRMWGGAGDDRLEVGSGTGSSLYDGAGDDTLIGGAGDDDFATTGGNDTVTGAGGTDSVTFEFDRLARGVRLDLQVTGPQDTGHGIDSFSGIERVVGTGYKDVLRGTSGAEHLSGHYGDDIIMGRGGADELDGEWGRDVVDYSQAPGPVVVDLTKAAPQATGADGNDTLRRFESVIGSRFADSLTGDAWGNVLDGGAGADTLRGGDGSDRIIPGSSRSGGADGADDADGGRGIDGLYYTGRLYRVAVSLDGVRNDGADPNRDGASSATEEGDLIAGFENVRGGAGPDLLVARGPEANILTGGPGADVLDAFDGSSVVDKLICGAGADTYRADPSDAPDACETAAP
ncbi:MAG TPA: hypothetical protein VF533_22280 [Solirubrobacteraceae bacterium]|jgi:hypothetical protein